METDPDEPQFFTVDIRCIFCDCKTGAKDGFTEPDDDSTICPDCVDFFLNDWQIISGRR